MTRLSSNQMPLVATFVISWLAVAGAPARVQADATKQTPLPAWDYSEVPVADRQKADGLYTAGQQLTMESNFPGALEKFEKALKFWNHPAIHGQMSVVLNAMGNVQRAYQSVKRALAYGPVPLGKTAFGQQRNFRQYQNLQRHLESQLVKISASTRVSRPKLFVGDDPLRPDADEKDLITPGMRRVSANKKGYVPFNKRMLLQRGTSIHLDFYSQRPFPRWLPWLVLGIGGGTIVGGAVVYAQASGERDDMQRRVRNLCGTPSGCRDSQETPEVVGLLDDIDSKWPGIQTRSRIGLATLIVGGGIALAGGAMVLWNTRRYLRVRKHVDGVSLVPVLSGDSAGVAGSFSF